MAAFIDKLSLFAYKKLCYRREAVRCFVSVSIVSFDSTKRRAQSFITIQ